MVKTPISYYGGKLNMLQHILPLIPEHRIYTEAFFGGGAVFFAKEPSESEIINDINNMVVNFYEVVKSDFPALRDKVEATLFSRSTYSVALTVYRMPHLFDKLTQAWAFYVCCNMGFSAHIGSWGFDKYGKRLKAFRNKKMHFDEVIVARLAQAQIECTDACTVIASRDAEDAFHYVDPPYIDSDQGHYRGYGEAEFEGLLKVLASVKGKFLLSSYPSPLLEKYAKQYGWHQRFFTKNLTAFKAESGEQRPKKVEVLTANYPI